MKNKDIHSLAHFLSNFDLKVIRKIYNSLGWSNLPLWYLEQRPGMTLILVVDLCQRNKITAGDFMNLFLLEHNQLNRN